MKLLRHQITPIPTMEKAFRCQKTKITIINDKNKMEDNNSYIIKTNNLIKLALKL
jgi:hypothetical protein